MSPWAVAVPCREPVMPPTPWPMVLAMADFMVADTRQREMVSRTSSPLRPPV